MLLTSQVINVAFYIEREKSDKFCSEALFSAVSSFMCRTSTTQDQRPYFPSEESYSVFLRSEKIHRHRPSLNPRASELVASMITRGISVSKRWLGNIVVGEEGC